MPEEKLAQPEEIQDTSDGGRLNVSEAMTPPRWREKINLHRFKILGGVLGVLVFAGAVFGAYKFGQRQVQPGPQPTPTPVVVATPTPDLTANWKTYTDDEMGFTIKYSTDMFPPRTPCDSFILYDSEEEKNRFQPIRQSGQEIGFIINGLELGICVMGRSLGVNPADYAKSHSPEGAQTKMTFAGKEAVKVTRIGKNFEEIFVKTPSNEIIRIWYRYGRDIYKSTFNLMLSTFRFLE